MKIQDLNPNAKLWIYASDRKLTPTEIEWLNEQLNSFAQEWASHGSSLLASAEVLNPYFVAFAVDLSHENASGCSIDKSVRLMKDLGTELKIDFFNRLHVWKVDQDLQHERVKFSELKNFPMDKTYDVLIDLVGKLNTDFFVPINHYLKSKELI